MCFIVSSEAMQESCSQNLSFKYVNLNQYNTNTYALYIFEIIQLFLTLVKNDYLFVSCHHQCRCNVFNDIDIDITWSTNQRLLISLVVTQRSRREIRSWFISLIGNARLIAGRLGRDYSRLSSLLIINQLPVRRYRAGGLHGTPRSLVTTLLNYQHATSIFYMLF